MKKTLALLSLVAAVFAAPAHAQLPNATPFSFEVRGGLAFPIGDFGEGIGSGTTVGGNATFHFTPRLGIYGAFTRNEFGADIERVESFKDQGFSGGVRVTIPTPLIPIDPYVKVGAALHQLDRPNITAADADPERGLGFEVGAGAGIGLGPKLSFTPQVTYTRYDVDEIRITTGSNRIQHIRLDAGLRLRL